MSIIRVNRTIEAFFNYIDTPSECPDIPLQCDVVDIDNEEDRRVGVARNFRLIEWVEEDAVGVFQAELTIPEEYKDNEFAMMHDGEGVMEIITGMPE
jgi:hypothetical protein